MDTPEQYGPPSPLHTFHFEALERLHLPGTLVLEFEAFLNSKLQTLEQQYGRGAGDAKRNAAIQAAAEWLAEHVIEEAKHLPFLGVALAIPGLASGVLEVARWTLRNLLNVAVEKAFALLDGTGLVN